MTTTRTPPNLQDLPPPPPSKQGWPWTVASVPLPPQQPDGADWPRISIVTPSYNQGEFIEETIRSVLLQGYPNLEYIIIDGGSTDTTLAVIKKYEPYIAHWVSESDRGQSHALNKGFQQATGDFVGWQNSDDFYEIDALTHLAHTYQQDPDIDVLYGNTKYVDRDGQFLNFYPVAKDFTLTSMFPWTSLCNQSIFFSQRIFTDQFAIDESFRHCMDVDFFWRLAIAGYRFQYVDNLSGSFRIHEGAKTNLQFDIAAVEIDKIYKSIYTNSKIPHPVRDQALAYMYSLYIDCFDKSKLPLFRQLYRSAIQQIGLPALQLGLISRYVLSFMGDNLIAAVKQLNPLRKHQNLTV